MAKVGFIGLGHMGLPMAINLLNAGHDVTGFDLQQSAVKALESAGGHSASSLQTIARQQDVLITMLQTGEQVKAVWMDNDGLFANAAENTLCIDCSTIDVASARAMHQQANRQGFSVIDAPVSGGVAGAEKAALTFMVGGRDNAFKQAFNILNAMGKNIIHTGEAGSGQAAKICNNMILGISMIAISEAFVLADKLGLNAKKLHEVVTSSSGQCWAMSNYAPVPGVLNNAPADNDYQPGFTAAMMLKDLKLSQQSAMDAKTQTPLGKKAMDLYQTLNDEGMAQLDFSAIIKLFN